METPYYSSICGSHYIRHIYTVMISAVNVKNLFFPTGLDLRDFNTVTNRKSSSQPADIEAGECTQVCCAA